MRTICFCNLKGGVAKTTTTATVAHMLATLHGKKVLLIDADSQGNLSQYFGIPAEEGNSTLDLLENGAGYYQDFVTPTSVQGIDIIPADMSLMSADVAALTEKRCNLLSLADLCDAIRKDNQQLEADGELPEYDYILIDCPPSFSAACTAALYAADSVIIPIRLDAYSTRGMANLTMQITNMRRINDGLQLSGILVTQWTNTKEEADAFDFLRHNSALPVYRTPSRFSDRVSAATFAREPLLTFSPWSAATKDYKAFTETLISEEAKGNAEA